MKPTRAQDNSLERIQRTIRVIRGHKVMLDQDLAGFYGVTTSRLNEQFRRNRERFPADFVFQLTAEETEALRSQFAITKGRGGRRYPPYAFTFTEHGAIMLATVLNTPVAVGASVFIVRAFIRLREMAVSHARIARELDKLRDRLDVHDASINAIMEVLGQLLNPPVSRQRRIGFRTSGEADE